MGFFLEYKSETMKQILLLDAHNYDETLPEIYRVAVRGIIFRDGKLLLIQSNFGELKFPGGGQEENETDIDTLVREVLEETGYHVIKESIHEFGEVVEKRLSVHESMIWHQINRYYFCDIDTNQEECKYTQDEIECGFHQVWYTLEEAITINQAMLDKEGVQAWNQREYTVLKMLKEQEDNLKLN